MLTTWAAHIQAMTRQAVKPGTDPIFRATFNSFRYAKGKWGLSPVLLVTERRLALLDERRHAFLLVLGAEQRVEQPPLEQHAFGERRLVGAVHRLLRHHHRRQREFRDLRGDRERLLKQL